MTTSQDQLSVLNSRSHTTLNLSILGAGRLVVAGIGGIGSILSTYLALFLSSLAPTRIRLHLVDGDDFEERNQERMEVSELANKALVQCQTLTQRFGRPQLIIRPVDQYLSTDNVEEIIGEKDLVFSCVDNHATRKLLSDRVEKLRDCILISGGNDGVEEGHNGTYGNVQVHHRKDGRDLTAPLTRFHPEIRDPRDKAPTPSCTELANTSAPQILFANLAAASTMLNAFYRIIFMDRPGRDYDEVCFDILEARATPRFFTVE